MSERSAGYALTIRQTIIEAIKGRLMSAKDISGAAGVSEKEVSGHLEHIQRSVSASHDGERMRFVVEPSSCLSCGFVFRKRERLKTPSRCPLCRSEAITEMRFGIEEG